MTALGKPKKQFFPTNQPQKCCFSILWVFSEVSYQPVLEIKFFLAKVLCNYLKPGGMETPVLDKIMQQKRLELLLFRIS